MYTLVALEALVSMVVWTRAIENRDGTAWSAYAVITLAGLYTHNWFPFLVLAQGLWTLGTMVQKRSVEGSALAAYGAVALLYVPWLFVLRKQIALPVYGHLSVPGWKDVRETFYAWVGVRVLSGESWVGVGTDARTPLLLVSLGFLVRGLTFRDETRPRAVRTFLIGCLLPVSMAFLVSVFGKPIYLAGRYPIIGLPAYLLTVGRGFEGMTLRWRRAAAILGAAWVVLSLYVLGRYYWVFEKSRWKAACQWIAAQSPAPEALHLQLNAQYATYFTDYYLSGRTVDPSAPSAGQPVYYVVDDRENNAPETLIAAPRRIIDQLRLAHLTILKTR